MFGLLAIAIGLLLGVGMRLACAGGAVVIGLAMVGAGNTLGFGRWWTRTNLVQSFRWLA